MALPTDAPRLPLNEVKPLKHEELSVKEAATRPRIVHVSGDFPDPIEPFKTPVIRSLLELTGENFSHSVISLNRKMPNIQSIFGSNLASSENFDWGEAWSYSAPPYGVFLAKILHRLANDLVARIDAHPPSLLVGHKLTIEGLVVARAAKLLNIPYAITIQGNSDTKILAARPDLTREYRRIFHDAKMVFTFAPWALKQVERHLGQRDGPSYVLPCPTDLDTPLAPRDGGDGFLSVFHLRHHRNKNLAGIARALKVLRSNGDPAPFTLVGSGNGAEQERCQRQLGGITNVEISGSMDREQLRQRMNCASGFVLSSHRESYGLVFLEALFAGLPVVYPAGRAIAGYFDNMPFAIPVDPRDTQELVTAMQRLVSEESYLKRELADWQTSDHARQFMRPEIAERFADGLNRAIVSASEPLSKGQH